MPRNPHPQRRDFLKTAAAGAAGAMGISALKFDKLFAQSTGSAWTSGMQINPAIDNKRVICCHDPTMLANYPAAGSAIKSDFTSQNSYVDPAKVASNMDEMAMQLAQKTSATDAWSTIFRTGNAGGWASTRVAIKVNGINGSDVKINRVRVAVVKKICDVMVDQFGVKPANIFLYDACDQATIPYGPYVDANDSTGTKIRAAPMQDRAAALGGFTQVSLVNWDSKGSNGTPGCPADLLSGKVDVLVDAAVAKMHDGPGGSYGYGSVTLCMKNHLGTFTDMSTPKGQHSDGLHSLAAQMEINQHSAILGGNPVRQQLCIVDALLSNGASGPPGAADNRTDRLVMGTFAPFVDYFTANYILFDPTIMAAAPIPQKGLTAAATTTPQFVTSFGYTVPSASSASPDPSWVSYQAGNPPPINTSATGGTGGGSGGAGSGGTTSASGGSGSGGITPSSGGNKASGGSASGGAKASGGSASGGTSPSGGATGDGASGGSASGGTNASGGSASGGTNASGGSASGGTASGSGGAAATGGVATGSASGGSARTGGTTAGNGAGGSSGSSTAKGANSESGCDVAGVDRRATRWGAMLAFGAVVAEKLRRLVSGSDRSS